MVGIEQAYHLSLQLLPTIFFAISVVAEFQLKRNWIFELSIC